MNQQLFRGEERGRAFGIFGGMIGVATALGPTLGGLVIGLGGATNGWRLLFAINVPLGIAAIIFSLRLLPKKQDREKGNRQLDPVGVILLGVSIFCFMLPFVLTTGGKSDDPLRWFWLLGFAVGTVAFVAWERTFARRGKSPIMHFELFATRSFRIGLLVATSYFAGMRAAFLITRHFLREGAEALAAAGGSRCRTLCRDLRRRRRDRRSPAKSVRPGAGSRQNRDRNRRSEHYRPGHATRTSIDRRVVHGRRTFAGRGRRRAGHLAQPDSHPVGDPGNRRKRGRIDDTVGPATRNGSRRLSGHRSFLRCRPGLRTHGGLISGDVPRRILRHHRPACRLARHRNHRPQTTCQR
jgi:hypothetical protein